MEVGFDRGKMRGQGVCLHSSSTTSWNHEGPAAAQAGAHRTEGWEVGEGAVGVEHQ